MARTQRRQPQAPDPAALVADETTPKPGNGHAEEPPVDTENAQVEIKVKGSGQAARQALDDVAGRKHASTAVIDEAAEPVRVPVEEDEDAIGLLMSNPRNMVIVTRQFPRIYDGVPCAFRVEKYPCPVTFEQIENDIFARFGGKSYRVSIHPNTPTGEMRVLEAFMIEHPTTDDPIIYDEQGVEQEPAMEFSPRGHVPYDPRKTIVMDGKDPTLVVDDSPNAVMRRALLDQIKIVTDKKQLAEIKRQLKDIEEEERDDREEVAARKLKKSEPAVVMNDPRDARIAELERKIADQEKQKESDRFSRIELALVELKSGGNSKKDDNLIGTILTNQNTLIQTLITGGNKKDDNFEAMISKLKAMKDVFGSGDSRLKGLEERLLEHAFDSLEGGGRTDEDDDPLKFAVKQGIPVFKQYLEKRLSKESDDGKQKLSKEQIDEIYRDAAKKAATEAIEKAKKEGKLLLVPVGQAPPGAQPHALPAPAEKPAPKRPVSSEGTSTMVTVEPHKPGGVKVETKREESQVDEPLKPSDAGYDRKKAVNFVLNTVCEDITKGCPADTFAVGDSLDWLDPELLQKISTVSTGDDLDALLAPHADADKLAYIKEMGKNDAVQSWLRRIISTVGYEYQRMAAAKKA